MNGWIKLHRRIQDHWTFSNEKYFRWWITILLNVNYEEKKFPVGDELFICQPGESFKSIDEWTRLFGCSKKTTIKFLKMLKKDESIETKIEGSGNRRKHLLIVNKWNEYQSTETENYTKREPKTTPKGNSTLPPNKKERREEDIILHTENFKNFQKVVSFFDSKFYDEKSWSECYDKLIRIDKYSEDRILEIVKEFRGDGNWWKDSGNFESLLKLRKKNKEKIKYIDLFDRKLNNTPVFNPADSRTQPDMNNFNGNF